MNLTELQKEAHAIAKEKGWWDGPERSFGDLIALVHSELSEALEAYRLHQLEVWPSQDGEIPLGVPYELADVVIRVADMAEWYGVDDLAEEFMIAGERDHDCQSFGDWIATAHRCLSNAWFDYLVGDPARTFWVNGLAATVRTVDDMAAHYDIDLDAAIEAKMEYNRGRKHRHGGKAL